MLKIVPFISSYEAFARSSKEQTDSAKHAPSKQLPGKDSDDRGGLTKKFPPFLRIIHIQIF